MGHPFAKHRQSSVEKSRVGHITKRYAKGGAVHSGAAEDKKLIRKMVHEMVPEGGKSKHRADRPNRAKGGRVGKGRNNAKTVVNVITGGHNPAAPPPMPPAMGVAPPGATPPPMAAKPPMPMPGAGPGMPPPPMRAKGGRVNAGTAVFEEGRRNGTQVQHNDSGKTDLSPDNYPRKRVVTFASGGRVKRFEASDKVETASKLPGGGAGGEARLAKAHRATRVYAKGANK